MNGDVITLSELTPAGRQRVPARLDMPPGAGPRPGARARRCAPPSSAVVAERLFEAEVKTLGIEVTEAQIDAAIEDVKKRNNLSDEQLEAGAGRARAWT